MSQMEFGKLIGRLLNYTGTKNYALALELGYDVSYISKMINSKIYPSSKNANVICQKIAAFVTSEATDSARHAIESFLKIEIEDAPGEEERKAAFQNAIENQLFSAYLYSTEKENGTEESVSGSEEHMREECEEMNSYTLINPRLRRRFLYIPLDEANMRDDPLEMIILANLFELSRDDKLYLAAVKKDGEEKVRPDLMRFKLILSITDDKEMDVIFDSILLIYLVTNYSSANFRIYATNFPFHALTMSAKRHFAHFGIPGRKGKLMIATTSEDEKVIMDTYETLDELIETSCHPVFDEYSVEGMITSKQYMHAIIGKNIRVLIGMVNELFLPSDLLEKLAKEHFGDKPEVLEEIKNIDVVLNNATYNSEMRVLLYEQTLNNYVLTGELSFFNKKIKVSVQERKAHIKHMIHLLQNNPNIKVKIIKGYFIEEFMQYDNPSCYLSSILNYLRISSSHTDKTLWVIKDEKLNEIYKRFYEEAWENRGDIVSDNAIIPTIELSLNYIELLGTGISIL